LGELFKVLHRTVVLECYASKLAKRALEEFVEPLRSMIGEMVEYALEHNAFQATLHRVFYSRYRGRYPWIPIRVVKGAYWDAVRRAKSFRECRKRSRAYTNKPKIRRITRTYSDRQDLRLENGVLKLRTHRGVGGA